MNRTSPPADPPPVLYLMRAQQVAASEHQALQ